MPNGSNTRNDLSSGHQSNLFFEVGEDEKADGYYRQKVLKKLWI